MILHSGGMESCIKCVYISGITVIIDGVFTEEDMYGRLDQLNGFYIPLSNIPTPSIPKTKISFPYISLTNSPAIPSPKIPTT